VSVSARRLRGAIRALAAVVAVVVLILVVEYAAQHAVAGVALSLGLLGIFAVIVRRESR
jgi:hypothetical protein